MFDAVRSFLTRHTRSSMACSVSAPAKTYLNFPGLVEDIDFGRATFGGNYTRLRELKRKYHPTNLFRVNQNIEPAVD